MLASVYSYHVMVKSVSSCCVRGRRVLSNPVTYAVKIVQKSAGMRIIMVSSVCGIAYKNVTSGTHNGVQEVFTVKTSL